MVHIQKEAIKVAPFFADFRVYCKGEERVCCSAHEPEMKSMSVLLSSDATSNQSTKTC